MDYVRDCLQLIDKLTIRQNDQSCVVALHEIKVQELDAQRPECDVSNPGPSIVGDGDGGAKMILYKITEDLDRAYQGLAELNPPPC